MWEEVLTSALQRVSRLDLEQEAQAASERVVRWRHATSYSTFYRPFPLIAQSMPDVPGDWLDDADEGEAFDQVGLDGRGRAVVVVGGRGTQSVTSLWVYDDDGFDEVNVVNIISRSCELRRVEVRDELLVAIVEVPEDGETVTVRVVRNDGGRPVRVDSAQVHRGWCRAYTSVLSYDAAGEVFQRHGAVEDSARPEATSLTEAVASTLGRAQQLEPTGPPWDVRVHRREVVPDDLSALVEPLANALNAAIREGIASCGLADVFLIEVRSSIGMGPLPPAVHAASGAWRERITASSRVDSDCLTGLDRGVEQGDTAAIPLVDLLDDDALRACRILSTAQMHHPGNPVANRERSAEAIAATSARVSQLLTDTNWPRQSEPSGVRVALVGNDTLTPRDPRLAESGRSAVPGTDEASVAALIGPALAGRDGLRELLNAYRMPISDVELIVTSARIGLRLEAAEPGTPTPRSRLGGPPLLPEGERWPENREGQPMTFLAGIDLSELPERDLDLPTSGWLLFFAALFPGKNESGILDHATNTPGSDIRAASQTPCSARRVAGTATRGFSSPQQA